MPRIEPIGGGGGASGATRYADVDALVTAASSAADGTEMALLGVTGSQVEAASSLPVPHPLLAGVTIPALSVGKGSNGWSDVFGDDNPSEGASGIDLALSSSAASNSGTPLNLPSAGFTYGEAVAIPLGTLPGTKWVSVEVVFDVHVTTDAANQRLIGVGLYQNGTYGTGVMGAAFASVDAASFRSDAETYTAGTRSIQTGAAELSATDYSASKQEMTITMCSEHQGEQISVIVTDASGNQVSDTKTMSPGHNWRTLMESGSANVDLVVSAYTQNNTLEMGVTIKSIKVQTI